MRPRRYRYTPTLKGWVVTRDMVGAVISSIDCSHGGAQEAFTAKCAELTADGWKLGSRFADFLFAERGSDRIQVAIYEHDPSLPPPPHRSTP